MVKGGYIETTDRSMCRECLVINAKPILTAPPAKTLRTSHNRGGKTIRARNPGDIECSGHDRTCALMNS